MSRQQQRLKLKNDIATQFFLVAAEMCGGEIETGITIQACCEVAAALAASRPDTEKILDLMFDGIRNEVTRIETNMERLGISKFEGVSM